MEDVWVHGDPTCCQDGCVRFDERRVVRTPGGAANAARQLARWNAETMLVSPARPSPGEAWNQVRLECGLECRRTPVKTRFVDGSGRIVFRHDLDNGYGLAANGMNAARNAALAALRDVRFDAVLISDYDKGFLNESLIWETIDLCVARQI